MRGWRSFPWLKLVPQSRNPEESPILPFLLYSERRDRWSSPASAVRSLIYSMPILSRSLNFPFQIAISIRVRVLPVLKVIVDSTALLEPTENPVQPDPMESMDPLVLRPTPLPVIASCALRAQSDPEETPDIPVRLVCLVCPDPRERARMRVEVSPVLLVPLETSELLEHPVNLVPWVSRVETASSICLVLVVFLVCLVVLVPPVLRDPEEWLRKDPMDCLDLPDRLEWMDSLELMDNLEL